MWLGGLGHSNTGDRWGYAGLGVEYPDDWAGRYNVREVTIQSMDINPSVACKVTDDLSLAIGLRAEWFDLELKMPSIEIHRTHILKNNSKVKKYWINYLVISQL